MNHAVIMRSPGGPEVLVWTEVEASAPGPGQLKLRQTAVGVNYADVLQRSGAYPVTLPAILGVDGVGVVEETGAGVLGFSPGDRVAYTMLLGAYTQQRLIPAERAIKLPADIDDWTAAALVSKGLTAGYLLHDVHAVQTGDTILVHSAAGGVGSLLSQWASAMSATVIGTVSTDDKVAFARDSGCTHVIVRGRENVVQRVLEITDGAKLPVVYDSIGKDTFMASLDCLRARGLMVAFGASSGPVQPFTLDNLARRGSLVLTQPGLMSFIATSDQLLGASHRLWQALRDGKITARTHCAFPLRDAALAHRAISSGTNTGATILEV